MADVFNRPLNGTPPGGSGGVGYSIRSNGFASVGFAGGGPNSPVLATNAGRGRPAPTLNSVKMILEGMAGSLRRGEFTVTVYDAGSLESVIGSGGVGGVGNDITLSIGRSGPGAGGGGSWDLTVYKNTFQSDKEGRYVITVSALGKGMEVLKKDGIALPKRAVGKTFNKYANILGFPWLESVSVTNIVDFMMWEALDGAIGGVPITLSIESGKGNGSDWVHFIAPTGVKPQNIQNGLGETNRLVYFRLGYMIGIINDGLPASTKKILYDLPATAVETDLGGGNNLISGDPLNVLIKNDPYTDYPVEGNITDTGELIYSAITQPSGIFTSKAEMKSIGGDCMNIYVSYACLKGILNSLGASGTSANQADAERAASPGATKLDLEGFLQSVFGVIREATGGWVDLDIMEDPVAFENAEKDAALYIYNKNSKNASGGPTEIDDISGEGGVRSATISGDVPTGWQMEAFAKASPGKKEDPEPSETVTIDWNKAKNDLAKAGLDATQAQGISSGLRKVIAEMPKALAKEKADRPYPIGLSITCNGFLNPGFGQSFGLASLSATRWAENTAFTITRVTHQVQGQDWTTSLDTQSRLVP